MKLVALIAGACAVCRVLPNEHARCAVCEGSNQLVRVCAFCHEWNKRNGVAWSSKVLDGGEDAAELAYGSRKTTARPLRDAMAPTRPRGRPRSTAIDDAVIPQLLERRVRVRVERVDLEGRFRGTYERWYIRSRRQIAKQAGCSQHAVDRRYRDYAGAKSRNSRACSARPITK